MTKSAARNLEDEARATPVWLAMRGQTQANQAFIADILSEFSYADHVPGVKLATFNRTVYLVASDLFDEDKEALRELNVRPLTTAEIRASELYTTLREQMLEKVAAHRTENLSDDDAWIDRVSMRAKRIIQQELRHGAKPLATAQSILDRKIPKVSRGEGGNSVTIFVSEGDGKVMERAAAMAMKAIAMHDKRAEKQVAPALPAAPEPEP